MDTILFYRALDAVQRSLAVAGYTGFTLSRADPENRWWSHGWIPDFLEEVGAIPVPLLWETSSLPAFDCLRVEHHGWQRPIRRADRHGLFIVGGRVAVATLHLIAADATQDYLVIVGEREAGALQEFVDAYVVYARHRKRSQAEITVIGGDPIPRPKDLDWANLILPPTQRDEIRLQVDAFFEMKEAYARMGVPYRRGLLLTGPPGNGKTTLLRVIASRRPEPFISLSLAKTEKWDLPERVEEAFDTALFDAPAILCFEDVDTFFEGEVSVSYFLNRLDGLAALEGVLVLATTNHPEKLEASLTERPSRFDRVFVLKCPEPAERRIYLRMRFGSLCDDHLVRATEGLSMAQLQEVWVSACLEAIHRGLSGPTLEGALAAVRRLKNQKETLHRDGDESPIVGFRVQSE